MKKLILSALLCTALATACVLPVSADSFAGSDNWKVSFTADKEMDSNFATGTMTEALSRLQPGDDVVFSVALRNDSPYITEWYMTNKVLKSLEESQRVANSGAYTYLLTYTDTVGNLTVLYDSDSIGGTKSTAAGVGLHEATDSLQDFFFLDEVTPGEHGKVDLKVSLEGETLGNTYQDTMAQLQMNFAVELSETQHQPTPTPTPAVTPGPSNSPPPSTVVTPTPTPTPSAPDETPTPSFTPGPTVTPTPGTTTNKPTPTPRIRYVYKTSIPQTSDAMNLNLIAALCGVSGLVLLGIVLVRVRKGKKKNDGSKPDEK